ncbi:MAG TPA: peptide ABC transporter substrate-binding protein, partial [Rhizomicrobium sp.]|nr:peptide ABC transporter substrate-binding protein [Rhizomicrobium sp.]
MASGKTWNRRLALAGGAALAAGGGYLAFRSRHDRTRHVAEPGTLYKGNDAEPESLDPSLVQAYPEQEILGDLMIGLMDSDPSGHPVPGMATHWETSPDGLTWTFHLREALWSDGTPVTAQDFVFSWRHLLDPATAAIYAYFGYVIRNAVAVNKGKMPVTALGAQALDNRTLEIALEHPAPYMLQMMTHASMCPQPRHVVETKGPGWARPGSYVGNGPFLLKEWVPNGHVTLEKNPRFYDAATVSLKKVIYYPTDDYGAALQRFRAGELDYQDRLPGAQIDWVRAHMPETLDPVPQLITDMIAVNFARKPFDDIRVRQAISLAIEREAICERVLRGQYVPAYNLVPPTTANYPGGPSLAFKHTPYAARLAQARALMQQAGFGPGNALRTTLLTRATTVGIYRSAAAALQQMLAQIHIDISILPNDMMVFYDTIQQHNFDMAYGGWQADFDDASTFLELYITGGGNNWGVYSDQAFDRALAAAQQDANLVSRGQKLAAAEAILLRDHAIMPLYFWTSQNLTRPYLQGFE